MVNLRDKTSDELLDWSETTPAVEGRSCWPDYSPATQKGSWLAPACKKMTRLNNDLVVMEQNLYYTMLQVLTTDPDKAHGWKVRITKRLEAIIETVNKVDGALQPRE